MLAVKDVTRVGIDAQIAHTNERSTQIIDIKTSFISVRLDMFFCGRLK